MHPVLRNVPAAQKADPPRTKRNKNLRRSRWSIRWKANFDICAPTHAIAGMNRIAAGNTPAGLFGSSPFLFGAIVKNERKTAEAQRPRLTPSIRQGDKEIDTSCLV